MRHTELIRRYQKIISIYMPKLALIFGDILASHFFFIFRKGNHFQRKWNLPMVDHILKLQTTYSLGVILLMWFIYLNLKKEKIGVFIQREKTSTENN